ncbi:hypothetical protein [Campylobacter sp. RM9333]
MRLIWFIVGCMCGGGGGGVKQTKFSKLKLNFVCLHICHQCG